MKYMLEKSMNQSSSNNRNLIVETDVNQAINDVEKLMKKIKKLYICLLKKTKKVDKLLHKVTNPNFHQCY